MKIVDVAKDTATVALNMDELLTIAQSMNEVCNGLDQSEFETRMGTTHADVLALFENVKRVVAELKKI